MTGRQLLRGIDLEARAGEVTMLLGISGSGKTTLLKICKGLLAARAGTVRALGEQVRVGRGRGRLDPRVAYIPQQLGLVRTLSVLDNTLTGALARVPVVPSLARMLPREEHDQALEILTRLGLLNKADQKVYALSGGERQRVAIARALMQRPRVVLADEFVSDLDPLTSATIMRVIREMAGDGVAVLISTHEMEAVREHADHVVVLRDGRVVLDARPRPETAEIVAALS